MEKVVVLVMSGVLALALFCWFLLMLADRFGRPLGDFA